MMMCVLSNSQSDAVFIMGLPCLKGAMRVVLKGAM